MLLPLREYLHVFCFDTYHNLFVDIVYSCLSDRSGSNDQLLSKGHTGKLVPDKRWQPLDSPPVRTQRWNKVDFRANIACVILRPSVSFFIQPAGLNTKKQNFTCVPGLSVIPILDSCHWSRCPHWTCFSKSWPTFLHFLFYEN